jgi:two-component system sensor histidine kinase/response regulator
MSHYLEINQMFKILIVEDDAAVRQNIQDLLEAEEFEVVAATNGREAYKVIPNIMPDFILCDVMLPEMDGFTLYSKIAEHHDLASIPFVFLSAKADPSDVRAAMNLGADDYLTKPFTREQLLTAINTRLQKSHSIGKKFEGQFDELRTNIAVSLPHELRTPLTGIMGFSEYLLDNLETTSTEEMREYLTHILNSGKRLNRLVENYIAFSELQMKRYSKRMNLSPTPRRISVMEYLVQISRNVAYEFDRHEDLDLELQDVEICIAEKELEKIIEELIGNAFRFSKKGQKVHVTCLHNADVAEIEIRDHGIGMSPAQLQRLGGFVQINREKNEQQGAGLGLTIARQLVELSGGTMSLDSKEKFGTTVVVTLPAAR